MRLTNYIVGRLGADKIMHLCVGGWIEAILCQHGMLWMLLGQVIVFAVAILKDFVFDKKHDWLDVFASQIGAIISGFIYLLCLWIF